MLKKVACCLNSLRYCLIGERQQCLGATKSRCQKMLEGAAESPVSRARFVGLCYFSGGKIFTQVSRQFSILSAKGLSKNKLNTLKYDNLVLKKNETGQAQ
jgi:hypothetical protein